MAKNSKWEDDYWLLLMEIYLKKPVGTKPTYSRKMVELSMELHIAPERLAARMAQLGKFMEGLDIEKLKGLEVFGRDRTSQHLNFSTPQLLNILRLYANEPRKLARAVRLLREMNGFNNADAFYEGVALNEGFERDFRPVAEGEQFTPVMLILTLDLYFRLTPATMVAETPEVQELARLLKVRPQQVAEIMGLYQHCDPYLNRRDAVVFHPLLLPCQEVWRRYGNADVEALAAYARELKEYFK